MTVRTIDVTTLKSDLARGAVPLLVDVRTPGEFAGGHVPGAKNIPLDQVHARLAEFGAPGDEVHLICQSGARSAHAGELLAAKGLRALNVAGGTGTWRSYGYPLER